MHTCLIHTYTLPIRLGSQCAVPLLLYFIIPLLRKSLRIDLICINNRAGVSPRFTFPQTDTHLNKNKRKYLPKVKTNHSQKVLQFSSFETLFRSGALPLLQLYFNYENLRIFLFICQTIETGLLLDPQSTAESHRAASFTAAFKAQKTKSNIY